MPTSNNRLELSWLVGILPFCEQQALWEQISNPLPAANVPTAIFPPMGPSPRRWIGEQAVAQYTPWMTEIAAYRCPSDPGVGLPAAGRTNYVACVGDSVFRPAGPLNDDATTSAGNATESQAANRGVFVPRGDSQFRDILDGLANSIMAGEAATDLGDNDIRTRAAKTTGTNPGFAGGTKACDAHIDPSVPLFGAAPRRSPISPVVVPKRNNAAATSG